MVVVLPAPLGPRIDVTWPRAAVRVSPSTASACRYRFTRLAISTAGAVLTLASLWALSPGRRAGTVTCTTTSRHIGPVRPGRSVRPRADHRRGGGEPVPPAGPEPFQPGRPGQVDPAPPQLRPPAARPGPGSGQLQPGDLLGPQGG